MVKTLFRLELTMRRSILSVKQIGITYPLFSEVRYSTLHLAALPERVDALYIRRCSVLANFQCFIDIINRDNKLEDLRQLINNLIV